MEFTTLDGETLTGETWCPVPVASSVWVLMPDGTSRAVKLPMRTEVSVTRGKYATPKPWTVERGRMLLVLPADRRAAKYAPPLPPKAWREALSPDLRT